MSVSKRGYSDYRGLSTDEKPIKNVPNGSTFLEIDTGIIYIFDIENVEWREF